MKTIVLTHKAAKELDGVPEPARPSIVSALHGYALSGAGDVEKLTGRDGYRMRIGQYRAIFAEDAITILAIFIGRRSTTTCR